jgi:hypothetical protein
VSIVERTGPNARIIVAKVMPETTTEPTPCHRARKAISPSGAVAMRVSIHPAAPSAIQAGS